MHVLVAYATRHGATAGIAERIAHALREAGLEAEARDVEEVDDLTGVDAVVVGSAAYMLHWLTSARKWVDRHRTELAERPVWLFSSGPLGDELVDEKGRDVFETSRPKEFDEFHAALSPRDEKVFFGAWDPDASPVGVAERIMKLMPASRRAVPAGDFRDWEAIEAWASGIAAELTG